MGKVISFNGFILFMKILKASEDLKNCNYNEEYAYVLECLYLFPKIN